MKGYRGAYAPHLTEAMVERASLPPDMLRFVDMMDEMLTASQIVALFKRMRFRITQELPAFMLPDMTPAPDDEGGSLLGLIGVMNLVLQGLRPEYAVAMAEYEDDHFEAVVFDRKVRDATMQSSPEGDALPKDLSQLNLRRGALWAPIL